MSTYSVKACTANLILVAPPISNTDAAQFTKDDEAAIATLRQSHFYMICGRPKASFGTIAALEDGSINVNISLASGLQSAGCLHIQHMDFIHEAPDEFQLRIKANSEVLRIFVGSTLVFVTTPDDLLMRRGRRQRFIEGFDNHHELFTFDLLYVGIAKKNQDSYSRLIERGHKARMDILAAEPQRSAGARVSDETYLLLFAIDPILVKTFGGDADFDDDDMDMSVDYHRIIADAEKAVINIFKPAYNVEQYKNYPHGVDGLFNQGFTGYTYAIAEGISLNTGYGTIKGSRDMEDLLLSNDADFISVAGEVVTLHISGKDFNIPIDVPSEDSGASE
ncbi:hypothetical protein SNE35_06435 [Paucibacter sp. R3-3]|uniref:Uncharacterized protein n=1 Tax=Roseateles agri TaxID=3098619 RepID=A0ABU5DCX6_9BURK|nr:hypothetical protein [Paucibacter sp. R3-3]MDY0744133.1 hypothetical protein [Paucibacter sp. R3-3]